MLKSRYVELKCGHNFVYLVCLSCANGSSTTILFRTVDYNVWEHAMVLVPITDTNTTAKH